MYIEVGFYIEILTKNKDFFDGIIYKIVFNDDFECAIFITQTEDTKAYAFGQTCIFLSQIETLHIIHYNCEHATNQYLSEVYMDIEKIKKIMKYNGINAAELAKRTNRSRSTITRILNEESKEIKLVVAKEIAWALDVTLDEIVR